MILKNMGAGMIASWICPKWYAAIFLISICAAAQSRPQGARPGWKLVWSDEFDGASGSPIDPSKWVAESGGTGCGNQGREYYTAGAANRIYHCGRLGI